MLRLAYGKINLSLNVTNKTKPAKMHDLDMINLSISLHDVLSFKFVKEGNDTIITCNDSSVPTDDSNLITKVINKFKKVFNLEFTTYVKLTKNIPSQAGLGGGSSDASATLNALDKHFKTNMSVIQKMNFIKDITSDGPFMFINGAARVKGIGDIISPIKCEFNHKVAIIKPDYGFSTSSVYNSIDYKNIVHPNINKVEEALIANDFNKLTSFVNNSLYKTCESLNPSIASCVKILKEQGFELVLMSGSGSAVYGISNRKEPYKKFKELDKTNYSFSGIYKVRKLRV